MRSDEHQPTSMPDVVPREPPHWEQRLGKALPWYVLILVGILSLAHGAPFDIHLTGALQGLANILVVVAFVPYMLMGSILIFRKTRRDPAPNGLWSWGARLLVVGLLIGVPCILWIYLEDITGLLPRWHLSGIELRVIFALLLLMGILCAMGTILVVAASVRDLWRLVRSLWLGPPSRLRD